MPCTSGAPTTSTGSRSAEAATSSARAVLDGLEQRVLQEQVVDGVAGEAQLGEDRHGDPSSWQARACASTGARVGGGVGDRDRHRAGRDPGEPVGVGGVEVHAWSLATRR